MSEVPVAGKEGGLKCDGTKPDWSLIPMDAVEEVVKVMTFGARKYAKHNWCKVEPERYLSALLRHLTAIQKGEVIDPDSGLPHMSHVACNAIFLTSLQLEGKLNIVHPQKAAKQ